MASSVQTAEATEKVTAESKTSPEAIAPPVPVENGSVKEAETSTPEESEEAVWSTIATTSQTTQATEKEIPDSTKAGVDLPPKTASSDVKKIEDKEAVPSAQDAPSKAAPSEVKTDETKEIKEAAPNGQDTPSMAASSDTKKVETTEAVPAGPSGQDTPSTAAPIVAPTTKTEEVKVEEVSVSEVVSKIVSGVAEDIDNIQDGLAREVASATGETVSDPSLLQTIEGGLKVIEKEVVKGVVDTVQAVEAHPELIAEGVLAAAVGAASLVQPELLPGAIAIVGKMASDSMKKTVVKIATDEGKKIGAAIGKDISDDAAKEKAADKAKEAVEEAKEKPPSKEGATDAKIVPAEASNDAPKASETAKELTNSHNNTEKPTEGKIAKPEVSTAATTAEPAKTREHEPAESPSSAPKTVEEQSSKVEVKPEPEPKALSAPDKGKEASIHTPEHPSTAQQESKPLIVAAAASVTKTTTTTKTTNDEGAPTAPKIIEEATKPIPTSETVTETPPSTPEQPSTINQESTPLVVAAATSIVKTTTTTKTTSEEPSTAPEKTMANISQESLDQLHQKIDSLHIAIKQITETLALHLPPPTPTIDSSKQKAAEVPPTSEPEIVSIPPVVLAPEPSHASTAETAVDPVTSSTEDTRPKRPSPEKRSSVLGSIGKILWPFGTTKTAIEGVETSTADSNAPKVPTVTVTEVPVPLTPEIRI